MYRTRGENFDRLLSRFVSYARSANAIDETRADFDRVGWGGHQPGAPEEVGGRQRLEQVWFAGTHSDIGGSYEETESRLSDIALGWMIEQASGLPGGIIIDGQPKPGSVEGLTKLQLSPSPDGVGHSEVTATNDTIVERTPRLLLWLTKRWSWPVKIRDVKPEAVVHPSVDQRFALADVARYDGSGPYKPEALRQHLKFKHLYKTGSTGAQLTNVPPDQLMAAPSPPGTVRS